MGSQTTTLALYGESLTYKWDMVLILKFRMLDMDLGAYDVAQYQNIGYYNISFVYGAHFTSLCPLDTIEFLQRE